MRIILAIILGAGLMSLISCNLKSDSGGEGASSLSEAKEFPLNIQKGGEYKSLDQIRVQARTIIEHRISESDEALSMLTYGYWWPEFVFNAGAMSKENEYLGHWLKFNEDFSYTYGKYGKTTGRGKYHFRLDDKTLYMLDDNVEFEPKVWTANYNADVIALVGTHQYGVNNGMQIKMIGLETKPEK